MEYTETDNVINLTGALPTTDATGMVRLNDGEYFDFTITSSISNNTNINYEISAKEEGTGTIDGSNIKLYLTEIVDGEEVSLMSLKVYNEETSSSEYTGRPSNEMSLYQSTMNSSEEHTFRLRMYVTEEYNPQGDGGGLTFAVRVNVYGQAGDKMPITTGPVNEVLLSNIPADNLYDDGTDTFITGEDPNNYVWYSGKLWRAVLINNDANTTKLVTNYVTAIPYSSGSGIYEESFVRDWLNDTTVDGFLYNLRDYDDFIVTDSVWDATMNSSSLGSVERPNGESTVTDAVGLLNTYEYQSGCNNIAFSSCYLRVSTSYTLTPYSDSSINYVSNSGIQSLNPTEQGYSVNPSINLKESVKIVDGDGTEANPYRLEGDNDTNLSGTLLSSRYSGEYIEFGVGENNQYRIVSHENGTGTKIIAVKPLVTNTGSNVLSQFNNSSFATGAILFSSTNVIGSFLNNDYLNPDNGYLTQEQVNMIEENTTWYLGRVSDGENYKFAKYASATDDTYTTNVTTATVGLPRVGELVKVSGASWTLTPYLDYQLVQTINVYSLLGQDVTMRWNVQPSLNLKSNVIITGGDGTKNNPFALALQ